VQAEEQADCEPPEGLEGARGRWLHALGGPGDGREARQRREGSRTQLEPEQVPGQRLESSRQALPDEGCVADEQGDGDALGDERAATPEARDERLRHGEPEAAQDEHQATEHRGRGPARASHGRIRGDDHAPVSRGRLASGRDSARIRSGRPNRTASSPPPTMSAR